MGMSLNIIHRGWNSHSWNWYPLNVLVKYLEKMRRYLRDAEFPIYKAIRHVLGHDNAVAIARKNGYRYSTPPTQLPAAAATSSSNNHGMEFVDDLYYYIS